MRILKYIFLLLLLAFVGLTVYVATQKGEFKVTTSGIIKTPKSTVFDYVNDYRNLETFGSWMQKENGLRFNYDAKTIGKGARVSWQIGSDEGNARTVFVKENDSICHKIMLNGTTATVAVKFKDTLGGTKIIISGKGKMDLMTKVSTFFDGGIESVLTDAFEKTLRNLDKTLDYEMKTYSIKINGVVQRPSGYCLKQTVSCHIKSVGKNTRILMGRMIHFFKKNKITMAGKPFVSYDRYDVAADFATISVCIPVKEQVFISSGSDIISGEMAAFTCLKTTLTGDYSHSKEAWAKAQKYIIDNGYKQNYAGSYTEAYIRTIDDVKQPSKWVTEIYIPVFPKEEPKINPTQPVTVEPENEQAEDVAAPDTQ